MAKRNLARQTPSQRAADDKRKLSKARNAEDNNEEEDLNEDDPEEEGEDPEEDENAGTPEDEDNIEDDPEEEGEDPEEDENAEDDGDDSKEKARCKSIMRCKEAKGRRALAEKLAFDTKVSVKEAKVILSAAPRAGGADPVSRAMGQIGNPALGTGSAPSSSAAKNPLLASIQKHRPDALRKR
jgi:hypothetical protein